MANPKPKEYVIRAFSDNYDESFCFLAFRFQKDFFDDISDILDDEKCQISLSFPVEPDFFILYRYKKMYSCRDISMEEITSNPFLYRPKLRSKKSPDCVVDTIRLHICNGSFHFEIKTVDGCHFHTIDMNKDFIVSLERFDDRKALQTV